MLSIIFDNMILGTISNGQGSLIAVDGTHRTTLRTTVESFVRGLSLRYDAWRALVLKRAAAWCAMPAVAVCPSNSANRHQRDQRWMSAVVVDHGPVGVC
jgi:hypothetical protein